MQENNENQENNSNYTNENPGTDAGRKSVADTSNNWENMGLNKTNIEGATISGSGSGPGTGDPDTSTGSADVDAVLDVDTEAGAPDTGEGSIGTISSGIESGAEDKALE